MLVEYLKRKMFWITVKSCISGTSVTVQFHFCPLFSVKICLGYYTPSQLSSKEICLLRTSIFLLVCCHREQELQLEQQKTAAEEISSEVGGERGEYIFFSD